MKIKTGHIYFLQLVTGLLTTGFPMLSGQSPYDGTMDDQASSVREHIETFTDRSFYIVNETIHFRADYNKSGWPASKPLSTVLYVELVTASGRSVAQAKYPIESGRCKGSMAIPGGVLTGNYFLRSYTRWMRNFGPESFSYTPLKIINPFISETAGTSGEPREETFPGRRQYLAEALFCRPSKPLYHRQEEVRVNLGITGTSPVRDLNCCVSVVPAGAMDTIFGQYILDQPSRGPEDFNIEYIPEPRGASISGSAVFTDEEGADGTYIGIHFSILGRSPDYFATRTDMNGRFVAAMPDLTENQDFFVAPEPLFERPVSIRIDHDFDQGSMSLSSERFMLNDDEQKLVTEMAIRMQLSDAFRLPDQAGNISDDPDTVPFYGIPAHSVLLDDYVNLPTLEEVFINLVPDVNVIKRQGRRTLKISSDNSNVGIYPPLVMIDYIPVFDHRKVMSIPSEKIRNIDVINEVYVKGDISYGGIVSIFTKNGDMAGIDLPEGSYFFDYLPVRSPVPPEEPDFSSDPRIPDTGNTLLWMDDLPLERGSAREIRFDAPVHPGWYTVLVRGAGPGGKVFAASARFRVDAHIPE